MRTLSGLVAITLSLLGCLAGLYVSAANPAPVILDLLFWPQVTIRAGLLVVLSFAAGAMAGVLAAALTGGATGKPAWRRGRGA